MGYGAVTVVANTSSLLHVFGHTVLQVHSDPGIAVLCPTGLRGGGGGGHACAQG